MYLFAPQPGAAAYAERLLASELPGRGDVLLVGMPPVGLLETISRQRPELRLASFGPSAAPFGDEVPRLDPQAACDRSWDLVLVAPDQTLASLPSALFAEPIPSVLGHARRSDTVAIVSLPKSGTNLLHRLLRALDYRVVGDGASDSYFEVNQALFAAGQARRYGGVPFDFFVSTFAGQRAALSTHALRLEPDTSSGDLGGDISVDSPLWTWISEARPPLIFNHRDPRDVLISLVHYLVDDPSTHYWNRATGTILKTLPGTDERVGYLLRCVPRYLDVYFRQHFWLLFHPAVCKVSFEQLVGAKGGGSDAARMHAVLRVMEHVGFEGDPAELGRSLLSQETRTFRRGRIGGWREELSAHLLREFDERHGDVLDLYGYPRSG